MVHLFACYVFRTDFKLSQWFMIDVDPAFGCWHCVEVVVASISEECTASNVIPDRGTVVL
jgi:hypothetical protein